MLNISGAGDQRRNPVILVDSSVWIDHVQRANPVLTDLLSAQRVLVHPFVIGELSVGSFRSRQTVLRELRNLPRVVFATDAEVLRFIDRHVLFGVGIGYIDASLLASTKLEQGTVLWTRDKRLRAAAETLSVAAKLFH